MENANKKCQRNAVQRVPIGYDTICGNSLRGEGSDGYNSEADRLRDPGIIKPFMPETHVLK